MTSNSILIGAELDKIISILTVTAILAVAISRARRLLTRAVAERAAAQDLSRFFSPEIVRQITASEQEVGIGHGRARTAAILNCDIRGFTLYATTVDPNELMATLAEYQRLIVPIIQSHGGAIDKFMGDGIMATFGAAAASETYAADSMRTAEAIIDAVESWKAERQADGRTQLRVGVAVATGQIIFGAVGDDTRLEYTVIGDAVNRSAKLEKYTKIEQVRALTDTVAYEMAVAQGYRAGSEPERRGQRRVEGLENPVDLIVLAR
jgi:adenylate cyclase